MSASRDAQILLWKLYIEWPHFHRPNAEEFQIYLKSGGKFLYVLCYILGSICIHQILILPFPVILPGRSPYLLNFIAKKLGWGGNTKNENLLLLALSDESSIYFVKNQQSQFIYQIQYKLAPF